MIPPSSASARSWVDPARAWLLRFCMALGVVGLATAGLWLELAFFGHRSLQPALTALLGNPVLGPISSTLAVLMLLVSAVVFWGARRAKAGHAAGVKILVGGLMLGHAVAFISSMALFAWLPTILRCLRPSIDPFQGLERRQSALLLAVSVGWICVLAFDLGAGWVLSRRSTGAHTLG